MSSQATPLDVLVVLDGIVSAPIVMEALRSQNYAPLAVQGFDAAREHLRAHTPSAILPVIEHFDQRTHDFVAGVHEQMATPIVVIPHCDDLHAASKSLRAGADDYVCEVPNKPGDDASEELIVRLETAIRVATRMPDDWEGELVYANVRVDLGSRRVFVGDQSVPVTRTEYRILVEFLRNPGRLLSAEDLLKNVWGRGHGGRTQYVRVYIHRLRKLLGWDGDVGAYLQTVRGQGYRLMTESEPAEENGGPKLYAVRQ